MREQLVEITDEMRAAVFAAECERRGHVPDIDEAISNDPTVYPDENTIRIRADTPGLIPHIRCRRCGHVWLIIDDPGQGYDHAVAKLQARLHDPESIIPEPVEAGAHDHALPRDVDRAALPPTE